MTKSRMPALFIGHGSPMNALEQNRYTEVWQALGQKITKPKAILVVSAHWYTKGTAVTAMKEPETIHDFGGFPQVLFNVEYRAPGSPELALRVQHLLAPLPVIVDKEDWGLDHGAWEILLQMYPAADIPVVQLSIDGTKGAIHHYQLGKTLAALRDEGILILASGNVVHNLRMAKWDKDDESPYPWALGFNKYVRDNLSYRGHNHPLIDYLNMDNAKLAVPTPDHYYPLLYILGVWDGKESISIPVDGIERGSISMLSVLVGEI